jgi:Fe-Mn family superoxide dismutase
VRIASSNTFFKATFAALDHLLDYDPVGQGMLGTKRLTTRRELLGAAAVAGMLRPGQTLAGTAPAGPYTLPPLPYAYDSLEPYIDAETMRLHHDLHHAAYVDNLNKAVAGYPELAKKTVEELLRNLDAVPEAIRTAVRNHGGGHANHTLLWQIMSKNGAKEPHGELAQVVQNQFGSFNALQDQLTKAAASVFGSGWAWLSLEPSERLAITTSSNQDTPLSRGHVPLLGIDVWEHAYYLKYQNKRAEYLTAFQKVIDWGVISEHFRTLVA